MPAGAGLLTRLRFQSGCRDGNHREAATAGSDASRIGLLRLGPAGLVGATPVCREQ